MCVCACVRVCVCNCSVACREVPCQQVPHTEAVPLWSTRACGVQRSKVGGRTCDLLNRPTQGPSTPRTRPRQSTLHACASVRLFVCLSVHLSAINSLPLYCETVQTSLHVTLSICLSVTLCVCVCVCVVVCVYRVVEVLATWLATLTQTSRWTLSRIARSPACYVTTVASTQPLGKFITPYTHRVAH